MCLVLDKVGDLVVSKKSEIVDLVAEAHNLALKKMFVTKIIQQRT